MLNPSQIEANQQQILEELLRREEARESFSGFCKYVQKDYREYHHSKIIVRELEEFFLGNTPRLILTVPPRYGKSFHSSILLPCYILGKNPDDRILLLSYGSSLSGEFNREVQSIMDAPEYARVFPDSVLGSKNVRELSGQPRRNSDVVDIPGHKGMFTNSGITGGYTGKGFEWIILDDLIKSSDEANSPTYRERTWNAFTETIRSRRASDQTKILILNTRWHPKDITGMLLEAAIADPLTDQWKVVNLPVLLSDCEDIEAERWKFPPGQVSGEEVLWPEKFSYQDVLGTRASSEYAFAAQQMGTPTARGGNYIRREWFERDPEFNFLPERPDGTLDVQSPTIYIDWAFSDSSTADETVLTVSCKCKVPNDENWLMPILYQYAGQWKPFDRDNEIEKFCLKWNLIFPNIPIWVESGMGEMGIAGLRDRLVAKGLNCKHDQQRKNKVGRSEPFVAAAQGKRIPLYTGNQFKDKGFNSGMKSWGYAFVNQCTRLQVKETATGLIFVGGKDDRLDSAVGAHAKLTEPTKKLRMF